MRVAHLSTAHPIEDTRIYIKECRTLADNGYDVHWVVPAAKGEVRDGIRIHALPVGGGRFFRFTVKPVRALMLLRAIDPAVVHYHDPDLMWVALILRAMGKKVIYDAHEDLPRQVLYKTWIPAPLRKPLAWLVEKCEDAVARRLTAVVAATPHIAKRFAPLNARAVSVSNYPLLSELDSADPAKWDEREKFVVYAGNLSAERGGYELIEAAKMSGVVVHVAGNLTADLTPHMKAAHDAGHIVFHGMLSRDAVLDLMRRARAGLVCFHALPNHTEAQPNKLFEYMSAALPLVASNFPLWRDMIDTAQCGICADPRRVQDIASAMRRLMDNAEEAKTMGLNGQRAVVSTYNWETEAKKLLALYADLQKN